jgi:chitodextrinase
MSQLWRAAWLAALSILAGAAFAHAAQAATPPGLVAAYSFDSSGSTVADVSGNGNTGTVSGAAWTANGKYGGAYSFNGSSSTITVPDSASLDLTTGMTLEAWVDPTVSDTGWHSVLFKEQPGMLTYALYANAGSKSPHGEAYLSGGTDVSVDGTAALGASKWTHLAETYDGSSLKLYVNGTLVKTTAAAGSLSTSNGAFRIGGNSIWGEYYNGLVDDVRVYNRALSATEISTDMSTPLGGGASTPPPAQQPAGLVAAYSLDQNGSTVADASGNGNTGTVSGATWTSGGKFGGAYSFNGSSSYIDVKDSPSLDLTNGMTLEAWVKPSAASTWRNVIMKEQQGMLVYALYANGASAASHGEIYTSGGNDVAADSSSAVPTSTWTHLAVTYDGSTLRLYQNGSLVGSSANAGTILTSTGDLRIGGDSIWGEWFNGLIDEVRVYNRALSASEIGTDMTTGIGTQSGGTADTTAPSTPTGLAKSSSTQTSVTLGWTASTDNVGVAGYDVKVNGSQVGTSTTTSYTASGLTCGTTYTFAVDAYDASANKSGAASVSAATSACSAGDTTAPSTPTGLAKTSSTTTSVTLGWTASTDNVGVTGYDVKVNGTQVGTPTSTSYTASGLTCGTTYTFAVDAYDAAGNKSGAATVSAATSACAGDTTPPSTPGGFASTGSTQTSISVSWTASTDNVGVTGYTVYSNGSMAGTTSSTSYTVSGLVCGTSYQLAVASKDAAGNNSSQATTTASTAACSGGGTAQLFVSPNGSDSGSCSSSAPCKTFGYAYKTAQPGQTVQIAGGTYPAQTLASDSTKANASSDVTFVDAPGATVNMTGDLQINGSHVHFVGPITDDVHHKLLVDMISTPQHTSHVTVENFSGEDFVVGPASYVTIHGGNFGPSVGCSDTGEYENKISASSALPGVAPDHITIDGVTIHDQTTTDSVNCHNGGLNIVGGTYLTIQNNRWYNNMVYDIEFDDFTGSFPLHDVTIQNNWFGAPTGAQDGAGGCSVGQNCKGEADVQVKWNGVAANNWLVRFNSFQNGFAPEWGGAPPSYTNFRIVGNAGGNSYSGSKWMACAPQGKSGVTIAYNAWAGMDVTGGAPSSAACNSTDVSLGPNTNYGTSSLPYVSASITNPNFHLVAGSKAQGIVTPTSSDYALATDQDGNARTAPRDAGADNH